MYNIAERQSMSNEMSKSGPAEEAEAFRLEVTGDFLLLLTLTWFFCGKEALGALALAAAVHELGHAALFVGLGQRPRALRMDAAGLCFRCPTAGSEERELLRTLAGPAAGLLLGLVLRGSPEPFLRLAAGASLVLSGLNLLPASCLDGGRLMRSLAALAFGPAAAERISQALDWACILLFLFLGLRVRPDWLLWSGWVLAQRLGKRCGNG